MWFMRGVLAASRTVEGEPSKPPLQAWILNSPLAGLSGRLALDVREQRAPLPPFFGEYNLQNVYVKSRPDLMQILQSMDP